MCIGAESGYVDSFCVGYLDGRVGVYYSRELRINKNNI